MRNKSKYFILVVKWMEALVGGMKTIEADIEHQERLIVQLLEALVVAEQYCNAPADHPDSLVINSALQAAKDNGY